jgi:hypothetical protein
MCITQRLEERWVSLEELLDRELFNTWVANEVLELLDFVYEDSTDLVCHDTRSGYEEFAPGVDVAGSQGVVWNHCNLISDDLHRDSWGKTVLYGVIR